jgi:hypothetical protein
MSVYNKYLQKNIPITEDGSIDDQVASERGIVFATLNAKEHTINGWSALKRVKGFPKFMTLEEIVHEFARIRALNHKLEYETISDEFVNYELSTGGLSLKGERFLKNEAQKLAKK